MQDIEYMKLAISNAHATRGQTSPNPQVGAVIVKEGAIIGMGTHLKAGAPHAEVHAIREAGECAAGADLYVTLEPCSHSGKTPPCVDAIIEAGISNVFIACLDPNPLVSGKGVATLKQANIHVETGLLEEDAAELNEAFFHYMETATPYVTMKAAVSIDGKTAAITGDSKWITSIESRQDVHRLRHEHDAILTGIQTIIYDNPQLTTRLPRGGKNPIRIILDTHLSVPPESKVVTDQAVKTIIYTGCSIDQSKAVRLQNDYVEVVPLSSQHVSIKDVLADLGQRNVMTLLVEGGSSVHASFVKTHAFQQMIVYMAPKIIGGTRSIPFIGGEGINYMEDALEMGFTHVEKIGPDIKMIAKPLRKDVDDVYGNC